MTTNPYAEHAPADGVTNGELDYTPATTTRHGLGAARADVLGQVWELGENGANTTRLVEALALERSELDQYLLELEEIVGLRRKEVSKLQLELGTATERVAQLQQQLTNDSAAYLEMTELIASWRRFATDRITDVGRNNTGRLIKAIRAGEPAQ